MTERRNAEERKIEHFGSSNSKSLAAKHVRNEISSRKETITRVTCQIDRLQREEAEARAQTAALEHQLTAARDEYSGQQAGFGRTARPALQEAEQASRPGKTDHATAVKAAAEAKATRGKHPASAADDRRLAVQRAYSTESVQQFFNHVRGLDWEPLGILADFVEVEPRIRSRRRRLSASGTSVRCR